MQPTVTLRSVSGPTPAGGFPISSLRMQRSVGWPVGQAEAELSGAAEPPSPGAAITVEAAAGKGGSAAVIFTGQVVRLARTAAGARLILEEATGPLTRLRVDTSYQSTTASAIISDLAGRAKVKASVMGTGARLPGIAILSSRSAMDWILHLALLSGFRLATRADGTLVAESAGGPAAAAAAAGALAGASAFGPQAGPVLGLTETAAAAEPVLPIIFGDGAFTRQGSGAETWVLQDPSALKAGSGSDVLLLPALKSPADVSAAESGLTARLEEAARERHLHLMGPPPADLNGMIMLQKFPYGNGPARVAAIDVLWHSRTGLQSRLTLHGPAG